MTEEQLETRFEINRCMATKNDCFSCRVLMMNFCLCHFSFITLKYLCDQGERGSAGLDGRPGLDGKPGVSGPPGQRVGGSYFYLKKNACCIFVAVFWLLCHRGILGKRVILEEM